jgi:hypothetical protein
MWSALADRRRFMPWPMIMILAMIAAAAFAAFALKIPK